MVAMKTSDTPETDAYIGEGNDDNMTEGEIALCEFARKMERERNSFKKAICGALLELYPPARPAICRRILREAMGQDPNQIYNNNPQDHDP